MSSIAYFFDTTTAKGGVNSGWVDCSLNTFKIGYTTT